MFGGQIVIATYGQGGVPQDALDGGRVSFGPVAADSPDADHVAFGMVAAENGFRLAAYDVFGASGGGIGGSAAGSSVSRRADGLTHTESFFLLLNGETFAENSALWEKLSDSATVIASLPPAGSASMTYGMLTDRFGVTWVFGSTPS